ncbi:MAG: ornithine carbamoyltransferase [Candidatus Micrarchaeia archaeon]
MDLLTIRELPVDEMNALIALAEKLKREKHRYSEELKGKVLALLFEKPSTRTRVSFEAAMASLGGATITLDFVATQISRGETIADTARVLERYVDAIGCRLYKHSDLEEMARYARVPVINLLTDLEHPCQALGDLLTMKEKGKLGKGRRFAYIGDIANNMANSLMVAVARSGMEVALAGPPGYPACADYVAEAKKAGKLEIFNDPLRAAENADVIYTDVWVSMGMEEERAERMKAFVPFQVNSAVLSRAKKDCIVMHCLPAHRGLEITSDVLDGKHSVVWDQAENRLHIQKAILLRLLAGRR